MSEQILLPDGSAVITESWSLPKDHWLFKEGLEEAPAPFRVGLGPQRSLRALQIIAAGQYALRRATMNGTAGLDPDALIQNLIVGLLGCWTQDGGCK